MPRKNVKQPALINDVAMAPAITPAAREAQLTSLAMDLVEQRLRDGTATSQETVYFLKLGSRAQQMENDVLREKVKLYKAKAELIESTKHAEELYQNALDAMKRYSGVGDYTDENLY